MTSVIVQDTAYLEALSGEFPDVDFIRLDALTEPVEDERVGLIIGRPMPQDASWMQLAKFAEYVHFTSTGYDELLPEWLEGRTLTTAKGTNSVPVAEFAVACVLARVKNIPQVWEPDYRVFTQPLGTLQGAKVAVLGYGTVGRRIVEMLRPFTDQIAVFRRRPDDAPVDGVVFSDVVGDVLAGAAHVILALELTDDTRVVLDHARIGRLAPGAHVVNVGRAGLVDQDALLGAAREGRISLTLDVTAPEPLPLEHPLRDVGDARLSPHVAWSGPQVVPNRIALVIDNLRAWLTGGDLTNVVLMPADVSR
ncbi:NAD(P)-dependent oxidoreductase [Cryobacterium arcticum]|uniref:Hydroxyacid dehydrogenase n=1 Tax=Cryobacterium arcticum TaxID=670052 RepID=A0A318A4E1_9MICO|nr:NAD(P)-dependent oxidoreductase [Cryobacterium arcticum]PXA73235.1 hydroxyacid dehydrogenase [Cryobacterium arcticum]